MHSLPTDDSTVSITSCRVGATPLLCMALIRSSPPLCGHQSSQTQRRTHPLHMGCPRNDIYDSLYENSRRYRCDDSPGGYVRMGGQKADTWRCSVSLPAYAGDPRHQWRLDGSSIAGG